MTDEDFKYMDELRKTIHRQEAEIESLKNECFGLATERDAYKDVLDTAVTEAIKEFAKRLTTKIVNTPFIVNCTGETYSYKDGVLRGLVSKQNNVIDMIDSLVNEMAGEE